MNSFINNVKKAGACLVITALLLTACSPEQSETVSVTKNKADVVRVTGEIESADSVYFGPPTVPNVWQYTISFMAPEGRIVEAGAPILKFDPQELITRLRDKRNALNEKHKQLDKQRIVAREVMADLKLSQQEAIAGLEKARLKADIPVELLASRDYKQNKLILKQAQLTLQSRGEELVKQQRVQDTEINILEREIDVLSAEVAESRSSVERMTINASGPGVVIHSVDRRNNKQEVGDSVWVGRRVIELPDLSKLQVHLEVPERESARIEVGQRVRFVVDAAPDKPFFGEIIELASVIHTRSPNQPARIFDATVSMQDPDSSIMRPGMSVSAEIFVREAQL